MNIFLVLTLALGAILGGCGPSVETAIAVVEAPGKVQGAAFPASTVVQGCAPCVALTAQQSGKWIVFEFAAQNTEGPVGGLSIEFIYSGQEYSLTTDATSGVAELSILGDLGVDPFILKSISPRIGGENAKIQDIKHGFTIVFDLP